MISFSGLQSAPAGFMIGRGPRVSPGDWDLRSCRVLLAMSRSSLALDNLAGRCHPHRARLPFGAGLRRVDSVAHVRIRRSALWLARISDCRQPSLVRLRHVLRLARRLPDVADVFFVRPVRVVEPCAQAKLGFCSRSRCSGWVFPLSLASRSHAARPLSGVSRDRRRPERRRLLCADYLALPFWPERPAVVPLAAPGAQFRCRPACNWIAPNAIKGLGRWSAAAGRRPCVYFAALVAASALAYVPLALAFTPWAWSDSGPFGAPVCAAAALCGLFLCGSRNRRRRHR